MYKKFLMLQMHSFRIPFYLSLFMYLFLSLKTIVNQMYAAMNGDSLSQLALSYKHQIGLDGVVKDLNIAAGLNYA